ncbi:MAG TPA: cation:proton antiporter, partial [Candidatus Eremiobacteraceae bacterium]|nr:cation:proton antiporter [Candidatus Eremiobacteraceae bacterium]
KFHASGLIAAIVAGMFLSRVGSQFGSFSSTRQSVNQLWEFFAFVANSMLFLLVGLAINLSELRDVLIIALWGILAVGLGRVVTVYGLCSISSLLGQRVPVAWQHVLSLAGLRGALSMALALSLPSSIAHRDLLIAMVFSVVLFTLVAQGLAIAPALVRLQAAAERASH